eukprot:jgi/Tetstr1/421817/TSEL_012718.t1
MGTMTESPSSLLRANSPRPGSPLTAGRVGSPAAAEEASVSYDKVIGLFTHSLSSELYDRHVAAIHRMCRAASEGFAIRELPKVDQIVQFTIALLRKTGAREVEEAATHLLRTLALPFLRRTSTDEFKMMNNISSMLSTVGTALDSELPPAVQIAAAEMLAMFASAYGNRPSTLELEHATEEADMGSNLRQFHSNQRLVQRSGVIPGVVAALHKALDAFVLKHTAYQGIRNAVLAAGGPGVPPGTGEEFILKDVAMAMAGALLEFSYSPDNAQEVVRAGGIDCMPGLLAFHFQDPAVFLGLELLWNCLESGAPGMRFGPIDASTTEAMARFMSRLLVAFLENGFRSGDKHSRNEVLLMLILMMDEPGFRQELCASGVVPHLVAVSTTPEVAPSHPLVKPFLLTTEPEELEMRQLAWTCLTSMCHEAGCREEAVRGGLLNAMLMYLDVEVRGGQGDQAAVVQRWTPSQLRSVQEVAEGQLCRLVTIDPGAFLEFGGPDTLLQLVAYENDAGLLEGALKVLQASAAAAAALRDKLGAGGMLPTALNLLCDTERAWPESVRRLAAVILGDLCQQHEANQAEFRRAEGVALLQQKLIELRSEDPTLPSKLTLVVLRAVWNCVIGSRKNMVRFLVSDGLDALLDVLEAGHASLHPICLSIVSDILENPKAHVFFHEWISNKSGRNAAALLIHVWRAEDIKRGINPGGQLANTTRPLQGSGQRTEWLPTSEVAYGFQAQAKRKQLDHICNAVPGEQVLAKVYSCFRLLGFPKVTEMLDEEGRAILASVEAYVKFRQGEIWQDLSSTLLAEGIEPTEEDAMRIGSGVETVEYLAETVRSHQGKILGEALGRMVAEEKAFYASKTTQQQQEREARMFKKDNTKMSMVERKEAKAAKEAMLANSWTRPT